MNSILSDEGARNLKYRITTLQPDSPAQWGKMNVAQMLAHCQPGLQVAYGAHQLPKYGFFMRMIGGMIRKALLKNEDPFKRNQPTDKSFKVEDSRDFEAEKKKLMDTIDTFSKAGREQKLIPVHPFFGKLSPEEWGKVQWKHLDHHLRQFGA